LIFDGAINILRFETADPFDEAAKLERFIAKLGEHVKILNPVS
jgi:hypothetical protein